MLENILNIDNALNIKLRNTTVKLPLIWLRDYCQCNHCQHPETKQRLFDTFNLPDVLTVKTAKIDENQLTIEWGHEEHTSIYPLDFLENLTSNPDRLEINRSLWEGQVFNQVGAPSVEYHDVMTSEAGLLQLLELTEMYGFCFVMNTPPNEKGITSVSERISYIRQTIFGGYYEMVANLEHKDTAYTPLKIEPHTDGTYSNDAPSYQVLHCLEERCEGGENVLVDGFKIAQVMKEKYPEDFAVLTQVAVPGQYIDTVKGTHLMSRRPIFRLDDQGNIVQVSYNNHDRAPFILEPDMISKFYRALKTFAVLYSDPKYHFRQKLYPGACLFFDNWRVLHARDAYTGYRKLAGVYFNKEDVESRLRVLRTRSK